MAFKIKRFIPESPLNIEGVDPGKKLPKNPYPGNTTPGLETTKSFKIPAFLGIEDTLEKDKNTVKKFGANERISGDAKKRINIFNSASTTVSNKPAPLDPSLPIQGPKQYEEFDTGFGKAGVDFVTGQEAVKEVNKRKTTNLSTETTEDEVKNLTIKPSGRQSKLSQTNLGKKGKQKKFGDEVTMQSDKFEPASKKSKTAPKDNSKKAIRKRKKADKTAGVSK